jgi:ubiquinol oxidase
MVFTCFTAVVLETVAAVPGMVGGMARHLRSLRRMDRDFGWIGVLLEEAGLHFFLSFVLTLHSENERMHLLTWMQLIKPSFFERMVVLGAQLFYTPFYALIYTVSPKTAHR